MFKRSLFHFHWLIPFAFTQSASLALRKSTSTLTYDAHMICNGAGPSHAEGLPLIYSETVYAELLSLCSAAHGARQNVGCFCATASGNVHCDRNLADAGLWDARYFLDTHPTNDALKQVLEGIGFPNGNVPFPLFCGSLCECRSESDADTWYEEHFDGVDVEGFVGQDGIQQPSPANRNSISHSSGSGAAGLFDGPTYPAGAAHTIWHNQCGKNCTSSQDCAAPAGENRTCTCQAHSAQYEPGSGTVAYAAACLVFLGSGRKREEESLPCPCNSTYVSHSCCDVSEGWVWELPDLKLGKLVI